MRKTQTFHTHCNTEEDFSFNSLVVKMMNELVIAITNYSMKKNLELSKQKMHLSK